MIKALLISLSILASSLNAASTEATQLTEQIAHKARNNLTAILGTKVNSKIEPTIQNFESVAPTVIDRNAAALKDELAQTKEPLSNREQHKLARKYAKDTTKEIKAEMKANSSNPKKVQTLSKRAAIGGWAFTAGTISVMAMGALIVISGLLLLSLIGYFISIIRRYMLYQSSFGYRPYPPTYGYPY